MLRSLPGDSAPRIRLLAKFVEKDYEKTARLFQLRREYASRLAPVDQAIKSESAGLGDAEMEERKDEWLSRRLDAGLFSLQVIVPSVRFARYRLLKNCRLPTHVLPGWLPKTMVQKQRYRICLLIVTRAYMISGARYKVRPNSPAAHSYLTSLLDQFDDLRASSGDGDTTLMDMLETLIKFL